MNELTKDLQQMILDKVNATNTVTLAFYREITKSSACLKFCVKRNRNDPKYYFTIFINNIRSERESILIRNKQSLDGFLKTYIKPYIWDTERIWLCFKDEDYDVPTNINISAPLYGWGLSISSVFNGGHIEENCKKAIDYYAETIEGLIAYA